MRGQDGAESLSTHYDPRENTLLSPNLNNSRSLVVQGKQKEQENPTGLQVVFEPDSPRKFDIIFVHGLGGTSRFTWSWNKDVKYFWPKEWLPLEPDIKEGRVLTFGYDAGLNTPRNFKNVSDFAKDLLFDMKFAKDGAAEELGLGKVCATIFPTECGKSVNSFAGCAVFKVHVLSCILSLHRFHEAWCFHYGWQTDRYRRSPLSSLFTVWEV